MVISSFLRFVESEMFTSMNHSQSFFFLTCFVFFLQDEIGGLVDLKGTHEDIYDFAKEADIVVCCLSLNSETV